MTASLIWSRSTIILLVLGFAFSRHLAAQVTAPDSQRVRLAEAALRKDMRDFVTAQEEYFVDHATYARSIREIGKVYQPGSGVSVTVVYASNWSHSAIGTSDSVPGLVCAVLVGDAPPPLGMGVEGEPTCRGPSLRQPDTTLRLVASLNRRHVSPGGSIRIEFTLTNTSDSTVNLDFFATCELGFGLEVLGANVTATLSGPELTNGCVGTDRQPVGRQNMRLALPPHSNHSEVLYVYGVAQSPMDPSQQWRLPFGHYRIYAFLDPSAGIALRSRALEFEVCWSPEQVEAVRHSIEQVRKTRPLADSSLHNIVRRVCDP